MLFKIVIVIDTQIQAFRNKLIHSFMLEIPQNHHDKSRGQIKGVLFRGLL